MRVGIMVPDLTAGDAVGNDARGMYQALATAGFDVRLFTLSGTSATPWRTFNYWDTTWQLTGPGDLLIYHYCTADADAISILRQLRCRKALKYHNITPSHYMAPYSPLMATMTRLGRMMLNDVIDIGFDWLIGDSEYNAAELRSISEGDGNVAVLPVFNHLDDLRYLPPEQATLSYLGRFTTNILSIGRIVPNKGYDRMLNSFGSFVSQSSCRPHLHLVGSHDPRLGAYISHLQSIIAKWDIASDVTFHSAVGAPALATYYRHCQLYWIASHHEGFCVPAVEAMAFGLPILTSSDGALRDTCGDAAIYGDTEIEMIDALERLTSDDVLLAKLKRRGVRRYEDNFDYCHLQTRFLAFIRNWIGEIQAESSGAAVADGDLNWFGLPEAKEVVREALSLNPALAIGGLHASDRRRAVIYWVLTEGRFRSSMLADYAAADALIEFGGTIAVPPAAARLSAKERLAWIFSSREQELFPLRSRDCVADYLRWYHREGASNFGWNQSVPEAASYTLKSDRFAFVSDPLGTKGEHIPASIRDLAVPDIDSGDQKPASLAGYPVVELKHFDEYIRSIGADVDHTLLNNIEVKVDIGFDFNTEDPFSDRYRKSVMHMYSLVANREYAVANEKWIENLEQGVMQPYPYITKNAAVIGSALQSLGYLLELAAPHAGERAVEFGVGWGNTTIGMAHTGAEVWAIDIEPNYLEMIRRRAQMVGVEINTVVGDFSAIADLPGNFDLALFYESFHHSADHIEFVRKLIGKLTPNGRIVWGGEPIYEEFWAPWGLRLDGLSVYCIRERGWLELGFRPSYMRRLLERFGLSFDFHCLPSVPGPPGWFFTANR